MTIDPKNLAATAKLTFADEFNTLSLRTGNVGTWATKHPWAPVAGSSLNDEQEWYIHHQHVPTQSVRPWRVENGILILEAAPAAASLQPQISGFKFTSGMITSHDSFSQQYGYFEMRAQLPKGQGYWPAFWLLPWPHVWPPEIDIMEVLGRDMTTLHHNVHTNSTGSHTAVGSSPKVADMSVGFHTYGANWQKDQIIFYFDGVETWRTPTPSDFHRPAYILANLALGGQWGGNVDATTPFPAQMRIDYIRAYADQAAVVVPPATPPAPTPVPPPAPPPASNLEPRVAALEKRVTAIEKRRR